MAAGNASPVSAPRPAQPFTPKQLYRLDEALTLASRETGILFTVYVGDLGAHTRVTAQGLHAQLGSQAGDGVLLAVSPGQRTLEIVTGEHTAKRLPDRSCSLAALSMTVAFGGGDLIGGLVTGLRMLSDQAGHPAVTHGPGGAHPTVTHGPGGAHPA